MADEGRATGILIAVMAFIALLLWGTISFSFLSLLIFFAIVYEIATFKSTTKDFWALGAWALFFAGYYFIVDYRTQLTLILLSFVLTLSSTWKTRILVIGFTILSIITLGTGFQAFLFFLAAFTFSYTALKSPIGGIIALIPLLVVAWFIGSGWGTFVDQKVSAISTDISVSTGISSDSVSGGLSSMLNNTLLLLTNPNAWYENQINGKRADDATSKALEITSIEALPSETMANEDFDITFTLDNKGKEPAENVKIMARGDEITKACGKISGSTCNYLCNDAVQKGCVSERDLEDIQPQERRKEAISFSAPPCPGTYAAGAKVTYDYTAYSTLGFEMISRAYYDELLRNDKIKFKNLVSSSSAGPFLISLEASRDQPIPDDQKFTLYVKLKNEHEGTAILKNVIVSVPERFAPTEENCKLKKIQNDGGDSAPNDAGYAQYSPDEKDLEAEIPKNKIKIFSCEFSAKEGGVSQIETFNIKTVVDYTFTYSKQTTITVKDPSGKLISKSDCARKMLAVKDATHQKQDTPQTRDAILTSIAKKINQCYLDNKNEKWLAYAPCETMKIMLKCGEEPIALNSIRPKVAEINPSITDDNIGADIVDNKFIQDYTYSDVTLTYSMSKVTLNAPTGVSSGCPRTTAPPAQPTPTGTPPPPSTQTPITPVPTTPMPTTPVPTTPTPTPTTPVPTTPTPTITTPPQQKCVLGSITPGGISDSGDKLQVWTADLKITNSAETKNYKIKIDILTKTKKMNSVVIDSSESEYTEKGQMVARSLWNLGLPSSENPQKITISGYRDPFIDNTKSPPDFNNYLYVTYNDAQPDAQKVVIKNDLSGLTPCK